MKTATQVVVPGKEFGNHCLTTGPITVYMLPGRAVTMRVIAFNWAAQPDPSFHSLS